MQENRRIYIGAISLAAFVFLVFGVRYFNTRQVIIEYPEPLTVTSLTGVEEIPKEALPAAAAVAEPVAKGTAPPVPDSALAAARASTVNILCIAHDSPFKPISGSGVIIDPRGVILTAAHIGQYFLLRDYPEKGSITCVIRTGSPAADAYTADPLFVSTHWVTANQKTLSEADPLGTGESDFALLYITGSASGSALPSSFPAVSLSHASAEDGDAVGIAAYGAEFLDAAAIRANLSAIVDRGIIEKRYTFKSESVDLLSISGSQAAQNGSSGGAVVNGRGELAGLITTSSPEAALAERSLRAITPTHIDDRLEADAGMDLDAYLGSTPLSTLAEKFEARAGELRDLLVRATGG